MEHEILRQVCLITQRRTISLLYIYNFFLLNNLYSIHIYFILNVWECGHEWVFPPWCACGWVCTWMWGMNFVVTTIINPCWCKKSGYGHKIYITFFFFFLCLPPSKYSCSIMPTMLVSFPEFLLHIDSPVLSATKDIWLR